MSLYLRHFTFQFFKIIFNRVTIFIAAYSFLFAQGLSAQCSIGWLSTPNGTTFGGINALSIQSNGGVILGGSFSTPGSAIARYDPITSSFSSLGAGISGVVYSLSSLPSGDIIAGGLFGSAGGTSIANIARWSHATAAWQPLSGGLNGEVDALAYIPNSGQFLVAGGSFSQPLAGGAVARNIALFDGLSWAPLHSGTNAAVKAVAVRSNGEIIAAGLFTNAGGASGTNHIAKYSFGSWYPLGSGLNGVVNAISILPNGDLVAGGSFTISGGSNLARYSFATDTWSPIGVGTNLSVNAIQAISGTSDILISGNFTMAGGLPANRIARVNTATSSFTSLASGTNGYVGAIALSETVAYLGGTFGLAGGLSVSNFARYSIGGSSPQITSQPPPRIMACGRQSVSLSVSAMGTGPLRYNWSRNGFLINPALNSSAGTSNLILEPGVDLEGLYGARVSNACGGASSSLTEVSVCFADYNCDGDLNPDDLADYIADYFSGNPSLDADFNSDGNIDPDDLSDFVNEYFEGC